MQTTRLMIKIFYGSSKQCWSSRLVWQTPESCHEVRACGGYCRNAKYQRLRPSLNDKELCASHSRDSTSVALFSHRQDCQLPLPQPQRKHKFYQCVFVIFRRLLSLFTCHYRLIWGIWVQQEIVVKILMSSSFPSPLWRFLQWMRLKNVFLVVCLMQTVPLFILWWPHSSSTCPLDGEDYCNSLLERLPAAQLCHLQPAQNAVTHSRPVLSKYDHPLVP